MIEIFFATVITGEVGAVIADGEFGGKYQYLLPIGKDIFAEFKDVG